MEGVNKCATTVLVASLVNVTRVTSWKTMASTVQVRQLCFSFDWLTELVALLVADIDECALNIDNCLQLANCNNTDGSFNCTCWPGYSGDGVNICESELN